MYQQERATSRTQKVIAAIAAFLVLNYAIRLVPVTFFVSRKFCLSLEGNRPMAETLQLCAWAEFMMVSLGVSVLTGLVILFVIGRDLLRRLRRGPAPGTLTLGLTAILLLGWGAASFVPMGLALGEAGQLLTGTRAEGMGLPLLLGVAHLLQLGALGYSVLHALEPEKMRRNHNVYCAVRYGT